MNHDKARELILNHLLDALDDGHAEDGDVVVAYRDVLSLIHKDARVNTLDTDHISAVQLPVIDTSKSGLDLTLGRDRQ